MKKTKPLFLLFLTLLCMIISSLPAYASSYNQGIYNENVPYGSATYIAISTTGNVLLAVTPTSSGSLTTGTNTVTVTSTDVVGYNLYIRSNSTTDMTNISVPLPTSSNSSPATLAADTWGYNTSGSSTNFVGSTLSDTLIRTLSGPASSGDATTVTYGVKVDMAKPAGNYTTNVIYTAVPQTD